MIFTYWHHRSRHSTIIMNLGSGEQPRYIFDKYLPQWSISQNLEQSVVLVTQGALSHLSNGVGSVRFRWGEELIAIKNAPLGGLMHI